MIRIGLSPNIIDTGTFVLSWHSIVTVVSIGLAVYLIARWGKQGGLRDGVVSSTAVWAIIGGIVGARLVHVADNWGYYSANPGQILAVWQGGIAVYGAIAGGAVVGSLYAARNRFPVRYLLDLSAPALILVQGIGRIGDIINGEHFATSTDLPWGIVYTHPESPAFGQPPSHPAVGYEMLADFALFGVLWALRGRLLPQGTLFTVYAAFYAMVRLGFSFLRLDSNSGALGLNQQGWISVVVLLAAVAVLAWLRPRIVPRQVTAPAVPDATRAARRQRRRHK